MQIIKHSKVVTQVSYFLSFREIADPSCGFSFPCDQHGTLQIPPCAESNYQLATVRPDLYHAEGVITFAHNYIDPAIGKCEECGTGVALDGFTCTCTRCGADYNWSGQRLAPRECWGEETGEHWTECL